MLVFVRDVKFTRTMETKRVRILTIGPQDAFSNHPEYKYVGKIGLFEEYRVRDGWSSGIFIPEDGGNKMRFFQIKVEEL